MAYPLTVTEIETAVAALKGNADYSTYLKVTDLTKPTPEGRKQKCLQIGKGKIPVLIVGGMHAREWAPPDALLAFAQNLLAAFHAGTQFRDSAFTWPSSNVDPADPVTKGSPVKYTGAITFDDVLILDHTKIELIINNLKLFIIPCANPDGREFTITHRKDPKKWDWRKNMRDLGVACKEIGVDLNRNYPIVFDYRRYYTDAAANNLSAVSVTDDPCFTIAGDPESTRNIRDTYQGSKLMREPEVENIQKVIDTEKIRFYLDVHSHAREIYYPWGINLNQTTDNSRTFLNPAHDNVGGIGGRPINDPSYGEFAPDALIKQHDLIARSMQSAILKNAGADTHAKNRSNYKPKQSFTNYGTPGSSKDYVFSTQFTASGNKCVTNSQFPSYAFTIETGIEQEGGFHPKDEKRYRKYQREIWSAVAAFTGYAAAWTPPSVKANSGPGSGSEPDAGSGSPPADPETGTDKKGICSFVLLFLLTGFGLMTALLIHIFF